MLIQQSQTARALVFKMVDSADSKTPKTGLTCTVTLSKNGGAFASPAGVVSEVGTGIYKIAPNATDSNTLGALVLHATAPGADVTDELFEVVAYNPDSATNLGLSFLGGDAFARLGAAGANLTALGDPRLANLDAPNSASGTRAATAILATPANKLVTDSSGWVKVFAHGLTALDVLKEAIHAKFQADHINVRSVEFFNDLDDVSSVSLIQDAFANLPPNIGENLRSGAPIPAKLDQAERDGVAGRVWLSSARTLTGFGTLVADVTATIWSAPARVLTAFGFTVATTPNATEIAIKAKTDQLVFQNGAVNANAEVDLSGVTVNVDLTTVEESLARLEGRIEEQVPGEGPVIVLPAPTDPAQTVAYGIALTGAGEPTGNASIEFRLIQSGVVAAFPKREFFVPVSREAETLGQFQIELLRSSQYKVRCGGGAWLDIDTPDADSFEVGAIYGK